MTDTNQKNILEGKISEFDTTIEFFINFSRAVNHDISSHLIVIKESSRFIKEDLTNEIQGNFFDNHLDKISTLIEKNFTCLNLLKKYYEEVSEKIHSDNWKSFPLEIKLEKRENLVKQYYNRLIESEDEMSRQMRIISFNFDKFVVNAKKLLTSLSEDREYLKNSINEEINAATQAQLDINRILTSLADVSTMRKVKKEPVQVTKILSNLERTLKRSLRASGRGSIEFPDKIPTLRVNRGDIIMIFYNILNNSIKYRKKDNKLKIVVDFNDEEIDYTLSDDEYNHSQFLYLTVSDNGVGIRKEDRKKVFEPGFRVKTGNDNIPGTGMGLANIKAIVERYRGKIYVRDQDPRQGTVIVLKIPRRYLYRGQNYIHQ